MRPPETYQRFRELTKVARENHPEYKKILEGLELSVPQAWGVLMQGLKKLGMSCIAEAVVFNLPTRLPQLFWLDRQMISASKWLASRFV